LVDDDSSLGGPGTSGGFELESAPGHLIRRAQQLHSTLWVRYVSTELTSVQFAVLTLLQAHPELDQRTIAEALSIDTSTLADVCRRLADRGLLERLRDSSDARRYRLHLTESAQTLLQETTPEVHAVGDALLSPFSQSEQQTFMDLLRRLVMERAES
jgi:DNA-binding MarR family transcriptional regulator